MILTIDVGNSNIVLGGYKDGSISFVTRLATERRMEIDQYVIQLRSILDLYHVSTHSIKGIAIASVVPSLTPVLQSALSRISQAEILLLSIDHAKKISVDIEDPAELGMDLLSAAIAVQHQFPLPAIIIDLGTATKLTALDKNGVLKGVSIAPGVFLSLNALVQNASLLSGMSLKAPLQAIGRNTKASMNSGIVLGTASMLDGMIDRFTQELGKVPTIVATGGVAPLIVTHCLHNVVYSETLVLDGLYYTYQHK